MTTVTMPQLGESVTEGTILKWLKQPGERVALDDPLCEIETEKVTAELPSPFEGIMGKILVPEGETVQVGEPLCEVNEGDAVAIPNGNGEVKLKQQEGGRWMGGPMAIPPDEEEPQAPQPQQPAVADGTARVAVLEGGGSGRAAPPPAESRRQPDDRGRFYSPAVMRLAREHAVDLGAITGTGIGGRVTRRDVERAIAAAPAAQPAAAVAVTAEPAATVAERAPSRPAAGEGAYEVVQLSATRRTIAENLKRSNLEAPQAWTMVDADVTELVALRNREKERFARQEGVDLTLLPYFTRAVCETLREYPMLNARWHEGELRQYRALNIGIAVASETGLVVPVAHDAGDLSVAGLAKRIAELVQRAHNRKLRVEDIEGGTFTVNNTGAFGSIASKPIVNYPQVAIVSMERVVKRPVVMEGDAIAVRSMVNVCLSFDHRAMDGLEAGNFLAALKRRLEAIG